MIMLKKKTFPQATIKHNDILTNSKSQGDLNAKFYFIYDGN